MELGTFTAFFIFIVCFLSSVQLPVSGKALQRGPPGQVFVAAGQDGYLPCLAKASAVTTREWSLVDGSSSSTVSVVRNGKVLVKEASAEYRGRVEQTEDGTLKLTKVTHRDSGTYRCYALGESSEEGFVSLVVAQVSEVHLTVDSSSNEHPMVRCECSGWGPKPQISLKDDEENDLHAETSSSVGANDFYTVRAHTDLTAVKSRLLTCRVEIPGMSLVKEKTIQISDLADHLSRPDATGGHGWVTGVILACVVFLVLVLGFLVTVWKIESLQPLKKCIQRLIPSLAQAEEAVPLLRDYRDISEVKTRGVSRDTAKAHIRNLSDYDPPLDGVGASEVMAEQDLGEMDKYKEIINSVGTSEGVHPGLIAAIISRQSEAGARLDKNSGYGQGDRNCFGLMQIHKTYHPGCDRVGPYSREHVEQGTRFFASLIKIMAREKKSWTKEEHLMGALASYIAGDGTVLNLKEDEDVDSVTPNKDFANDVVARAKWFEGRGYTFNS